MHVVHFINSSTRTIMIRLQFIKILKSAKQMLSPGLAVIICVKFKIILKTAFIYPICLRFLFAVRVRFFKFQ